jgi:hypothetical protein
MAWSLAVDTNVVIFVSFDMITVSKHSIGTCRLSGSLERANYSSITAEGGPHSGICRRAVLFGPALFSLRTRVGRLHSLDSPEVDGRFVDMDLPAITSVVYEGIEHIVDPFQPPWSPFGRSTACNLINPDPDKIVRWLSADKERVLRQLVKGNADIEPGQATSE